MTTTTPLNHLTELYNTIKAAETTGAAWYTEFVTLAQQDGPAFEQLLTLLIADVQGLPPIFTTAAPSTIAMVLRFFYYAKSFIQAFTPTTPATTEATPAA